jgi:hypothetical protein
MVPTLAATRREKWIVHGRAWWCTPEPDLEPGHAAPTYESRQRRMPSRELGKHCREVPALPEAGFAENWLVERLPVCVLLSRHYLGVCKDPGMHSKSDHCRFAFAGAA